MKTAFVVSSLAIAANAVTLPNIDSFVQSSMNKVMNSEHFHKAKDGLTTQGVKNEKMEIESHKGNLEVAFGMDCSDLTARVTGFQTEVCVDAIMGNSTDDSFGQSTSYRFVRHYGSDVPMIEIHWGHQCRDYMFEYPFLDPMEFGFPSGYQIGDCHVFTDPSGNPMFAGKMAWTSIMPEVSYPHAARGLTNKARNCDKKSKFYRYDIERTDIGMCYDDQDDDGNMSYYMWDTTNCDFGSIDRNWYLDDTCTTYNHTRTYYRRDCEFDTRAFLDSFRDDEQADIFYVYQNCMHGTTGV